MNCKELSKAVSTGELEEAGIRRRFLAWIHRKMCQPCDEYARQIRMLGDAGRDLCKETPEDAAAVGRLRDGLLSKLPPD